MGPTHAIFLLEGRKGMPLARQNPVSRAKGHSLAILIFFSCSEVPTQLGQICGRKRSREVQQQSVAKTVKIYFAKKAPLGVVAVGVQV